MSDHVNKLARAMSAAAILDSCAQRTNEAHVIVVDGALDLRAIARAVLLHLRDAPSDRDFHTIGVDEIDVRGSWQAIIDRMLARPAEPCPHEWGDTLDDDHRQTCQKCGATRGVAHGE